MPEVAPIIKIFIAQNYNKESTFDVTNVPSEYENQHKTKIFLKFSHIRRRRQHFQPHGCGATDGVRCLNRRQSPEWADCASRRDSGRQVHHGIILVLMLLSCAISLRVVVNS